MKIKQVTITASPDDDPAITNSYTWKLGDDLTNLELAIVAVGQYLDNRRNELRTALASQKPIAIANE